MFKIIALALAMLGAGSILGQAQAQDQYVNGYYKSNGTYVQPYYRSAPDGDPSNNYSTRGNVNPYTGALGTRNPDPYYVPAPSLGGSSSGAYGGNVNGVYGGGTTCVGSFC